MIGERKNPPLSSPLFHMIYLSPPYHLVSVIACLVVCEFVRHYYKRWDDKTPIDLFDDKRGLCALMFLTL